MSSIPVLSVKRQSFTTRIPTDSVVGTVGAEEVQFQVDDTWKGLQIFAVFANAAMPEQAPVPVLLDETMTCAIPRQVLVKPGKILVGLLGKNGVDTVKPTMWLEYSNASEQVPPDGGVAPDDERTKDALDQMVALQQQAASDAQEAKDAAKQASDSVASAGPYAEQAKQSAEAAKASQDAAATSAQQATQAAKDAQTAAGSIGDAVQRAEGAATNAAAAKTAAEASKTTAAQSAGYAQTAAGTAAKSAMAAQDAATQAGQYLESVEADAKAAANAATAAGKSQEAAQSAAQTAANARDQATTAATAAQGHADAAGTAKAAAEQAAATAGSAQAGAAQSAQTAASSASAAQAAQQAAEAAAAVLPKPTPEDAGKVLIVNLEGTGYVFGEAGGIFERQWVTIRDETTETPVLYFSEDGLSEYNVIYFELESTMENAASIVYLFVNNDTQPAYNISVESTQGTSNLYKIMYGLIFKGPGNTIHCISRVDGSANPGASMQWRGTTVYKRARWDTTFPVEKITIESVANSFGIGSKFKVLGSKEGL